MLTKRIWLSPLLVNGEVRNGDHMTPGRYNHHTYMLTAKHLDFDHVTTEMVINARTGLKSLFFPPSCIVTLVIKQMGVSSTITSADSVLQNSS